MSIRELVGHRSTLMMYRDCLKVVPLMAPNNEKAAANIKQEFRKNFEKQRKVLDKAEHDEFRDGIVRLLSNFLAYEVKRQYLDEPLRFRRTTNIYEPEHDEKAEQGDSKKEEESVAEVEDISKLPFM
mmetsp:Transcript_17728/g.30010  ORF Transcript_17728/g.30010 Transcript_17728/m.30010 type:complete len:127 (-) Transcript_17728:75-455(-)